MHPSTAEEIQRDRLFTSVVQPEIELLTRVAFTLTGSWSDAEEVVQEALIRAWRAVDRFDGRHPRAWLLTILRHAHLNSVRRRRPVVISPDEPGYDEHRPAFGTPYPPNTEEQALDACWDGEVAKALAKLDRRFRSVVLLVDVDQLSYANAAEVLGVPIGTVMSRLHRGRDRLRRNLAAGESEKGQSR